MGRLCWRRYEKKRASAQRLPSSELFYVDAGSGEETVYTQDFVAKIKKSSVQMGT